MMGERFTPCPPLQGNDFGHIGQVRVGQRYPAIGTSFIIFENSISQKISLDNRCFLLYSSRILADPYMTA
jgi:hypothetical protein